ncbi:hypothetical protein CCHL11_10036 [Colletotrichum chlorophyti]|uniref:Uncharacterized protein n=1 Tax=Colletotrichum chlorophyti TaxID=708187 RepID=A0A1Q8RWY2_9PEZI|nr:hypothetical protein CCHL11_10036 [Colletotrichum chlorophyti]
MASLSNAQYCTSSNPYEATAEIDGQHASCIVNTYPQGQQQYKLPSPSPPQMQSEPLKHAITHTQTENPTEQPQTNQQWFYKSLRLKYLLGFLLFDLVLLAVVVALTVLSARNQGFVTIPSQNISTTTKVAAADRSLDFSMSFDIGVAWTSIPSFVFALFAAYWGWIATAVSDRQPYIDLRKPDGAEAGNSVLLDYRFVPTFWRWWTAFRKSHATVGCTVLFALFLTYLIQPLSARLFAPQSVFLKSNVPVSFTAKYEGSRLGANMDWRPIMNAVAATKLYNGGQIPWTDNQFAYRPFRAAGGIVESNARVAANTFAFAAYLNCEVVTDYAMSLNRKNSLSGTVTMSGADRGCSFQQDFGVISSQEIYFKTTAQLECSAEAYYSRLVFTAATFSTSSQTLLGNVSVISCATGYRVQPGTLTASGAPATDTTATTTIYSFAPAGDASTDRPPLWRVFEDGIFSTTAWSQGAEWTTTDFGSLVLYYAQKQSPSDYLTAEVLTRSISEMFTSVYLTAVAVNGMEPTADSEAVAGTVITTTTRLFVVPWVAYIVVIFLVLAFGFAVFVLIHARKNSCILTEEPQGLLAVAGLLEDSNLAWTVKRVRQQGDFMGQVRKTGKRIPEVNERRWIAVRDAADKKWIISSVGRNEEKTEDRPS